MNCPVCQLELGIERREDELVLRWNAQDWRARCSLREPGDPVLCTHLRPIILKMLTITSIRTGKPRG
jgi:hypothetical protein